MKREGAYKREKKIYLNPMSKTTMGLWIGTSPRIIFDETESPLIKGKYLKEVLRHSQEGVPHPTDWENRMQSFLKEVGAKSWSKFAKTALSCTIELEGDQLAFLPYRNSGPSENYNFVPIRDRKMTISFNASDKELGLFLEKAFDASAAVFSALDPGRAGSGPTEEARTHLAADLQLLSQWNGAASA